MSFISKNLQFILAACLTISNTVTAGNSPSGPHLPGCPYASSSRTAPAPRRGAVPAIGMLFMLHSHKASRAAVSVGREIMGAFIGSAITRKTLPNHAEIYASVARLSTLPQQDYSDAIEVGLHLLRTIQTAVMPHLPSEAFSADVAAMITEIINDLAGPLSLEPETYTVTIATFYPYFDRLKTAVAQQKVKKVVISILKEVKRAALTLPR